MPASVHRARPQREAAFTGRVLDNPLQADRNGNVVADSHSWRLANVLDQNFYGDLTIPLVPYKGRHRLDVYDRDPCSVLEQVRFAIDLVGFDGGISGLGCFFSRCGSILYGLSGQLEAPPNQPYPGGAQQNLSPGRDDHPKGPPRHFLLGLQIAISALLFAGCFLLILFGLAKLADDGAERLFDGKKGGAARLVGGILLAAISAIAGASVIGYWLYAWRLGAVYPW